MRDLKFRAWHHGGGDPRVKGKMQYSKNCGLRVFFGSVESEDLAVEVMQFTGLRDKIGVEIYEGDIIKWAGDRWLVKWVVDGWFADSHPGYDSACEAGQEWEGDCIVVGNIHENPELLND